MYVARHTIARSLENWLDPNPLSFFDVILKPKRRLCRRIASHPSNPHPHTMSGPQNLGSGVRVLQLTETSRLQREQHEQTIQNLETQKLANQITVPTLPDQVRASLRELGLPVRLFGENLANVRDRLRMELAKRQLGSVEFKQEEEDVETQEVTKYTRASKELIEARQKIAKYSLDKAARRLETERKRRDLARDKRKRKLGSSTTETDDKPEAKDELDLEDISCVKLHDRLGKVVLEGSQYGDKRALSSISCARVAGVPLVATGSWTGNIQLWDGSTSSLQSMGGQKEAHEDRIMGLDMIEKEGSGVLATASLDTTLKLWKLVKADLGNDEERMETDENDVVLSEAAHLKGHLRRLCRVQFHPLKEYVATTSCDHTWRLWSTETGQSLLLQDGHASECYGIGFHGDGSLCSTTDFSGIVHLWDLRTGKSIHHFHGHAKRVLNAEFHPNGFQLATGGDDGTTKIWDLRRRRTIATIPVHSNVVTRLKFNSSGEFMASSSFDGTIKLWSCRDWRQLGQLEGHEGKVSGMDFVDDTSFVSCGHDKTLKRWH